MTMIDLLIPQHLVSALAYPSERDSHDLDSDDLNALARFELEHPGVCFESASDDSEFARYHAFTSFGILAATCVTCSFSRREV